MTEPLSPLTPGQDVYFLDYEDGSPEPWGVLDGVVTERTLDNWYRVRVRGNEEASNFHRGELFVNEEAARKEAARRNFNKEPYSD